MSSLPATIGDLSELTDLYLSGNQLSSLPATIGGLSNLEYLYLNSNQLSSLPATIGDLPNLKELGLFRNKLNNVPAAIGNLSSLKYLDLNLNQLSSVPTEIGKLSNLEYLYLNSNCLSSVPTEIGKLSKLNQLDLSSNKLSSVPAEIGNLSNLTYLNLAYNRITADVALRDFLDIIDYDWQATQTVPPTALVATTLSEESIQLTWKSVEFIEKGGRYEISMATTGSFEAQDIILDKSSESYIITDLVPGTNYFFRIRTYTPAHDGEDASAIYDDQPNELWSEYSLIVSATTLDLVPTSVPPTATPTFTLQPTITPSSTPTPTDTYTPIPPTATPTRTPFPTSTFTPTSAPRVDPYEFDDTCQQARTFSTDTSNQPHSFHQEGDEDWIRFELQDGVSYRLFAESTDIRAEPKFDIYLLCDDLPLFSGTNNSEKDAELVFTALFSGHYYARVKNRTSNLFGDDVTYQLSLTTQAGGDLAIIIAGHDDEFSLQQNIFVSANRAYRTFLAGDIPKDRIRYLSLMDGAGGDERGDADHDDRSDIDTEATVENIKSVITEWAVDNVDSDSRIFIYLVDHGLFDYMLINGNSDQLWADELDSWLTTLEDATGASLAVIYEACKSGSFISGTKSLSDPNRVIITSTDDETNAFPMLNGGVHFSDAFFSAVRRGKNFYDAFQQGQESSSLTQLNQQPMLDDNGDRKFDRNDGDLARSWSLSVSSDTSLNPIFGTPQAPQSIESGEGSIEVSVSNPSAVSKVWADVYRPGFVEPSPAEDGIMPELKLGRVEFNDDNGDGRYVGLYNDFTLAGVYRFVIYGQAGEDDLLMPTVLEVKMELQPINDPIRGPSPHMVYLPVITR